MIASTINVEKYSISIKQQDVNRMQVGDYGITALLTDKNRGREYEINYTLTVQDTTPPVLSVDVETINIEINKLSDNQTQLSETIEQIIPHLTATDIVDSDLILSPNVNCTISSNEFLYTDSGTVDVTVNDNAGNSATITVAVELKEVSYMSLDEAVSMGGVFALKENRCYPLSLGVSIYSRFAIHDANDLNNVVISNSDTLIAALEGGDVDTMYFHRVSDTGYTIPCVPTQHSNCGIYDYFSQEYSKPIRNYCQSIIDFTSEMESKERTYGDGEIYSFNGVSLDDAIQSSKHIERELIFTDDHFYIQSYKKNEDVVVGMMFGTQYIKIPTKASLAYSIYRLYRDPYFKKAYQVSPYKSSASKTTSGYFTYDISRLPSGVYECAFSSALEVNCQPYRIIIK